MFGNSKLSSYAWPGLDNARQSLDTLDWNELSRWGKNGVCMGIGRAFKFIFIFYFPIIVVTEFNYRF